MDLIKVLGIVKKEGLRPIFNYIDMKVLKTKTKHLAEIEGYFSGKKGLEIGGPSGIFADFGYIPLYRLVRQVDGCNFNNNTVWEGSINEGNTYKTGSSKVGFQYIADGTDLSQIQSDTYDFVLSSHSLEHIANPLKALREWFRILKPYGIILLVLPDKRFTFDKNRSITNFDHLLQDYRQGITERDLTHLEEIIELHNLDLDGSKLTKEQFKERALDNFNNRCLHHHVFDLGLLRELLNYFNSKVLFTETSRPYNLIIMAQKTV